MGQSAMVGRADTPRIAMLVTLLLMLVTGGEAWPQLYRLDYDAYPDYGQPGVQNQQLKEPPRKRFFGLDIPDYVTDDDRPKHVQDIIKRLKEKHYL